MPYARASIEAGLLRNDADCVGQVSSWIADVLASQRFWRLRPEWRDLVQEVLLRVVESLRQERFDPARDFRAYVQGVARFTALHALSLKRKEAVSGGHAAVAGTRTDSPEERALSLQVLRAALDSSSEDCRRLILLYFLEERSYPEIAAKLAAPVGTVKSRLFRCLRRIRSFLGRARAGG